MMLAMMAFLVLHIVASDFPIAAASRFVAFSV
jgi:hypothetical protein